MSDVREVNRAHDPNAIGYTHRHIARERQDAASGSVRLVGALEPRPGTTNHTRVSKPLRRAHKGEP